MSDTLIDGHPPQRLPQYSIQRFDLPRDTPRVFDEPLVWHYRKIVGASVASILADGRQYVIEQRERHAPSLHVVGFQALEIETLVLVALARDANVGELIHEEALRTNGYQTMVIMNAGAVMREFQLERFVWTIDKTPQYPTLILPVWKRLK